MDELKPDDQPKQPSQDRRPLRIRWTGLDAVPVTFANNFLCQRTPHEFIVTFSQLVPPAIESMTEEELGALSEVPARVVFQAGVAPERMRQLIEVLQSSYEGYLAWLQQTESEAQG